MSKKPYDDPTDEELIAWRDMRRATCVAYRDRKRGGPPKRRVRRAARLETIEQIRAAYQTQTAKARARARGWYVANREYAQDWARESRRNKRLKELE